MALHQLNIVFLVCLLSALLSWTLPKKFQVRSIGIITAFFLSWYAPYSFFILFFTSLGSYLVWHKTTILPRSKLLICIVIQFAILFLFKSYIAFSIRNNFFIPLGLSYYLFKQIHYSFEMYKRTLSAHSGEEYFCYLFFMPVILVGPINRFPDFLKDLRRRRWNSELVSLGFERCLYGYAKIVIIGNYCLTYEGNKAILYFSEDHVWWSNYLDIIRFPLNAYFQFAGYSDIAIGMSMVMGFRIIENFNNPFWSGNMNEFWKKYHISLSSWCRDYVFTPVASYTRKPLLGLVLAVLVLSLWHEVSLRYFLWGCLQVAGILLTSYFAGFQILGGNRKSSLLKKGLKVLVVFHFFALSCVLIRQNSWEQVVQKFKLFTYWYV